MSLRSVNYMVAPRAARPAGLRDINGRPLLTCEFDTSQVALGGFAEILQTSLHTNPLFALFEDLLVPNSPDLVWRDSGPGRGVEMRRTFSALFGRFFARAYLQRYHGFTWFAPLDGRETMISRRIRVRRTVRRGDMPDWLCAKPSKIAIAEAKGSRSSAIVVQGRLPGPLRTAADQIGRAQVETTRRRLGDRRLLWTPRRVKGWGVMSRWATEQTNHSPLLYAMDPETEGTPFDDGETAEFVGDIARFHLARLLEGVGAPDIASRLDETEYAGREAVVSRKLVTAAVPGEGNVELIGSAFGPQKILNIPVDRLQELLGLISIELADQLLFVGIDRTVIANALERKPVAIQKYSALTSIESRTLVGEDGLFVLPLSSLVSVSEGLEI